MAYRDFSLFADVKKIPLAKDFSDAKIHGFDMYNVQKKQNTFMAENSRAVSSKCQESFLLMIFRATRFLFGERSGSTLTKPTPP